MFISHENLQDRIKMFDKRDIIRKKQDNLLCLLQMQRSLSISATHPSMLAKKKYIKRNTLNYTNFNEIKTK